MLYDLVLSYEAADWNKITEFASQLGIPDNLLTSVYFICMENVNTLWEQLTNPYTMEGQVPAESHLFGFMQNSNLVRFLVAGIFHNCFACVEDLSCHSRIVPFFIHS